MSKKLPAILSRQRPGNAREDAITIDQLNTYIADARNPMNWRALAVIRIDEILRIPHQQYPAHELLVSQHVQAMRKIYGEADFRRRYPHAENT